jgi:hypothetical protein
MSVDARNKPAMGASEATNCPLSTGHDFLTREKQMGWASGHIEKLQAGETVSFRPRGNSMSGKIESGQLCTVAPVDTQTLDVGDIVLCKVNGREYLHLIKAIQGPRFQIGNNRGRINGWVSANAIYGKLVRIQE